jgi:hypothetical protein
MNIELKAAVIGHWRNGATLAEICAATNLFYIVVKKIILNYKPC